MIKLYDYQIDAIHRLRTGSILCGGVGSGKSLTSIGYFYILNGGKESALLSGNYIPMKKPRDLYIITTARKRDTFEWENELTHFLMSTNPETNYYENKIVIDSWNNIKKYSEVKNSFFIFDEDRVVGNGAWVKAFLKIAKNNDWIIASATPGDTWEDYIPVFIANGFYKHRTEFISNHIVYNPRTPFPQIQRYLNTGRLILLRDKILVDMHGFERKTVLNDIDIYCNYDIQAYKDVIRTRKNPYKQFIFRGVSQPKPIDSASEFCTVLRRILNTHEDRQVKLLEIIEDHPKAIIFYNFDYELDILKTLFLNTGITVAEWNGHMHQPIPKDDPSWVYLVQYNAGSEGWNCVLTDTIIFFSQSYSYKAMTQAKGRIDRLNTPYTDLYYYHLKTRGGMDLQIARALANKKKFNEREFYDSFNKGEAK